MVKTPPPNAGGTGSIPSWGTKFPHTVGCSQKLKKKKQLSQGLSSVMLGARRQKISKKF